LTDLWTDDPADSPAGKTKNLSEPVEDDYGILMSDEILGKRGTSSTSID